MEGVTGWPRSWAEPSRRDAGRAWGAARVGEGRVACARGLGCARALLPETTGHHGRGLSGRGNTSPRASRCSRCRCTRATFHGRIRHVQLAADGGDSVQHRVAARRGRSVRAVLLHRLRPGASYADRAHRHGDGGVDDDVDLARRGRVRGRAVAADPRLQRCDADGLRDPRAVGVHEHRDGICAAARGRARAHVHVCVRRERGDDRRVHDRAGRVRRRGRARVAAG